MWVWVLTSDYNLYDQMGEYFEAVFKDKPTAQQLVDAGMDCQEAERVLKKRRRLLSQNQCYHLRRVSAK